MVLSGKQVQQTPWRQGQCDRRIEVIKRLVKIAIGYCRLSPTELQTVLFEAANLCNEIPIGVTNNISQAEYIISHTVLPKISYLTSDQESLEYKKIMLKALG